MQESQSWLAVNEDEGEQPASAVRTQLDNESLARMLNEHSIEQLQF